MDEPETTMLKSFRIYPHHIAYLESFGQNTSQTLRTKIDQMINQEAQRQKWKNINEHFIPVGIGTIILLFSFLQTNTILILGTTCIGLFFILFGTIGGITDAVQTARRRKQQQ